MANPNFLILDEPTNDLDLLTLNVLEEFLEEYEGCLVIVTHDRHFMNKLSDHLFVFEGNGKIKDFPGTYSQYTVWKAQQDKTEKEEATANTLRPKTGMSYADKKKMGFNEKREFGLLEIDIPKLEAEKVELNGKLLVEADHEKLMELAQELETVSAKLEEKELRWLELSEYSE
jgi:ATP-binding cassette subfamily F protein uup